MSWQKPYDYNNGQRYKPNEMYHQLVQKEDELTKVLSISQQEEDDRQRALMKAKEEEAANNVWVKEFELGELTKNLVKIIKNNLFNDSDFEKIEKLFNEFEVNTGKPINEDMKHRTSTSMNGKSALILELIHVLKDSDEISFERIFSFFGNHLETIQRTCADKRHIFLYNPEMHELDKTSLFSNIALNDKLMTVNIRGDGNCLWNSISVALFGDHSMMETLRLLTASTLLRYNKEFKDYINQQKSKYGYNHELSFDDLIRAATELQIWGDELHIIAMSLALNRPIYSYGSLYKFENFDMSYEEFKTDYENNSLANHFKYIADTAYEDQTPIMLYYNGENHYSVVLPYNDSVVPLIPKTQLQEPIFNRKIHLEQKQINSRVNDKKTDEKPVPQITSGHIADNYSTTITIFELNKIKEELIKSRAEIQQLKTQLYRAEYQIKSLHLGKKGLEIGPQNLDHHLTNSLKQPVLHCPSSNIVTGSERLSSRSNCCSTRHQNVTECTELSDQPGPGAQSCDQDNHNVGTRMDID